MAPFRLTPHQRLELEYLLAQTRLAKERCRAQALLWLDAGEAVEPIAELLHVSRQTIYNWAERFRQRAGSDLRGRLADAPRWGRPPAAEGRVDPLVAQVLDTDPRDLGYHATVWTAPLLRQYLRDRHDIEVSYRTVGRAVGRLGWRWKRPRHQLALRPATWRQAKGG